ncbi:substrate-binding domain-containing protein [Spirochaeta isovalerica]|uniref:LacI family transcriptional regulator n=1 Tax=Spirochaeta isovalerica TaxID=150 RepID=A0A841R7D8_9SPIO|nr:substrate-binding domain-containing protein [Spirochaeta isovalerica]MBB6479765.1 LacI family transcriptional regulator [Spirochaeta isovalerica]
MITIKEIAEQAGVSIGTVDRVIHDRGRVSEKTKSRILSIMEKEGYRRNIVASQLSNSRKTLLAVLIPHPHQNDSFWGMIGEGIREASEKLSYFKLDTRFYFFDRYSPDDYIKQLDSAIAASPSGLLIAPILAEETMKFRDSIPENCKVVFFNSDLPEFPRLSCIGQDSYESGRTAGKLMHILTGDKGSIAVIEVNLEDYHINTRALGFKDYMKEHTSMDISSYFLPPENKRDEFEITARQILKDHKDLTGLFVPNSSVHFFAERLPDNVKIIGFDQVEANTRQLKAGQIDFLINQQPWKQGELALENLIKCTILQEEIPYNIKLPIEILCRENINSYE